MGGLAEREEGFLKSKDRSKISNCISHIVCWPCCSSVQQKAYSSMVQHKQVFCKCLENLTFFLSVNSHILIQIIFGFQVHKIALAKMFAVRVSNLTAMMLMMQVFLVVTQCHLAYGFEVSNAVPAS